MRPATSATGPVLLETLVTVGAIVVVINGLAKLFATVAFNMLVLFDAALCGTVE